MEAIESNNFCNVLIEDKNDKIRQLKSTKIKSGQYVYDLSMINPDLPPHILLMDKLLEATMKKENHRYAVSRGITKLRYAFSQKYLNKFSTVIDSEDEVCVTLGSKDAVSTFLSSCTKQGQKVLIQDPFYPAHIMATSLAGLRPFFFHQGSESLMLEEIERIVTKEKIDFIFLNFPSNPTGQVVSQSFYEELYRIVKKNNVVVYNDFAYGEMLYGNSKCPSILSVDGFKDYAIESYTLSKAYSVPGWRVGAMVGNKRIINKMSIYKSYIDYGLFLAIQSAASSVLSCQQDILKDTLTTYQERINYVCDGLKKIGWEVKKPQAGTCVWAKVPAKYRNENSCNIAYDILDRVNVCVTPGDVYSNSTSNYMRFALVRPINILENAIKALEKF